LSFVNAVTQCDVAQQLNSRSRLGELENSLGVVR
jgi:hypothetical protein